MLKYKALTRRVIYATCIADPSLASTDVGNLGGDLAQTGHLVLIHSENDYAVTELSRIAEDINSVWTPSQTLKKYRHLQSQLNELVPATDISTYEKFEVLRKFFFEQKKFGRLASKPTTAKSLLPYIFLSRSGPKEILILLFTSLAQSIRLQMEVLVSDEKQIIVKLLDQGKSRLFDFNKAGLELSTEQVIDLINSGCDCTKSLSENDLLSDYLTWIKTQCLRERSLVSFYKMQTYLVRYQPFALNHLVDRARAAYAIGDLVRAAEDISQYVAFHSDKVTNNKYLKLIQKIKTKDLLKNLPF